MTPKKKMPKQKVPNEEIRVEIMSKAITVMREAANEFSAAYEKENVDEMKDALGKTVFGCALFMSGLTEEPPSIITGQWAGMMLESEMEVLDEFSDFISQMARHN